LSAGPAFAFKNIEGCDVASFAAKDAPIKIEPERWQTYRDGVALLLGKTQSAAATDWRSLGFDVADLQKSLLDKIRNTQAYRDYLASESCRVIVKVDANAVSMLLGEVVKSDSAAAPLQPLVEHGLNQIDRIERSARFRSTQDRTLMLAGYYCFAAGVIVPFLPPERLKTITLEDFGQTASCKDAGRTG
jgi:hypothetical protein